VLIDFSVIPVFNEKSPQNPEAAHPQHLRRHTSLSSTLTLTKTSVTTGTLSFPKITGPPTRVHGNWLLNDETIGHKLANALTGVRVGNVIHFSRVQPHLSLTAAHDGRSEAFLCSEVDPIESTLSAGALLIINQASSSNLRLEVCGHILLYTQTKQVPQLLP